MGFFGKRVQKCVDRCNDVSNPSCVASTKNGKRDKITRTNCKADRFYGGGKRVRGRLFLGIGVHGRLSLRENCRFVRASIFLNAVNDFF